MFPASTGHSNAPGRRCSNAVDSRSPSGPYQGEGVADACRLDLVAGPERSLGLPVRWGLSRADESWTQGHGQRFLCSANNPEIC